MNNKDLVKQLIEKEFSRMNPSQFEAVTTINGALLILAGAGSGKTTVLVNRVACMIKYGDIFANGDEPYLTDSEREDILSYINNQTNQVPTLPSLKTYAIKAWQILAITFTNKAAGELKERIEKIDPEGIDVWASTFHSTCSKILRKYGDRIGYSSHYTIYDMDDSKRVIKDIYKRLNIEEKLLPVKSVMGAISRAKDSLINPSEYQLSAGSDFRLKQIASVYTQYQKTLAANDAMDFDDLICNTVRLFKECDDVLDYYQNRFRYIMVDEYQDTNHAQYVLVSLLANKYNNLCVVGDDDQSIYRFRGATIENILSFEKQFKGAKAIRLEQNYRSTSNILNGANKVISNNQGRKGKTLWTNNGVGSKITVYLGADERAEATFAADQILKNVREGAKFSDHAVLYRMNAQSSTFENVFARSGILYKVIGGHRFYDRKEIKDVLAYLQFICNPDDSLRLRRIINEPKRGIGDTTVNTANEIADVVGVSMFEIIKEADKYAKLSRSATRLKDFAIMMQGLIDLSFEVLPSELLREVLEKSGYVAALMAMGIEEQDRVENVNELLSAVLNYEKEAEEPSLSQYLEEVALITDIDNYDKEADRVVMMTLHSAKGLEFDNVFLAGMEEGMFPSNQAIYGGEADIEEERRLAYVGITRAKKNLFITRASRRMLFGQTTANRVSRFVEELPEECLQRNEPVIKKNEYASGTRMPSSYNKGLERFEQMKSGAAPKPRPSAPSGVSYGVGERVIHKTFGSGTVVSSKPMGNDSLLEIAFDSSGSKKLMANFAKLEKE